MRKNECQHITEDVTPAPMIAGEKIRGSARQCTECGKVFYKKYAKDKSTT